MCKQTYLYNNVTERMINTKNSTGKFDQINRKKRKAKLTALQITHHVGHQNLKSWVHMKICSPMASGRMLISNPARGLCQISESKPTWLLRKMWQKFSNLRKKHVLGNQEVDKGENPGDTMTLI